MRWVGSVVPAPHGSRCRSSGGREKHYGAVELSEAGQQVYVNDVVEILSLKEEQEHEQQQQQPSDHFRERGQPRLAQVLSMWEDAFTGVFKFRGRWLVRSSEVPEEALSRLRDARRAFATRDRGPVRGARIHASEDLEDTGEEVFLSHREDNLEMRGVVRHVTLSVPTSKTTEIPPEWRRKTGPRLTHAFDESNGDIFALESSHPILRRARSRQAELVIARSSRTLQDREAPASSPRGGRSVARGLRGGGGWLLPKAKIFETAAKNGQGGTENSSGAETSVERSHEVPDADATTGEADNIDDSNDRDAARSGEAVTTKRPRRKASELWPTRDRNSDRGGSGGVDTIEDTATKEASGTPTRTLLDIPTVHQSRGLIARSRRLAMPPAGNDAGSETVNSPGIQTPRRRVLPADPSGDTRKTSKQEPDQRPSSMELLSHSAYSSSDDEQSPSPLQSPKRKRGGESSAVTEGSDRSARVTPVGDIFQAEIPNILSNEERAASASPTGAELVWRSIRDWDESSRKSLSDYLQRAREIMKDSQAQIGVPVHVRLAGGIRDDNGENGTLDRAVAGSYAVWAITSSRDKDKVVRVACSEMAQTEVPRSGIQVVQFQEEALTALFKTPNIPGNYELALEMLADSRASPQSVEQWNLTQVRTLEKVLEQEFDPSRRPHDWSPRTVVDREDFIDLARVSKQIPGKSPSQVLAFYYRYIAAAEPLTDVVYGPEAANERKNEPLFLAGSNGGTANSINVMDTAASARPTRETAAETDRRIMRLYAPKPVQSGEVKQSRSDCALSAKSMAVEPKPLLQKDAPLHFSAFSMAAKGSRDTFVRLEATQSPYIRSSGATQYLGPRFVHGSMDAEQGPQREATPPKTIPPDVEVLEIGDSDEDNRAGRVGVLNSEGFPESAERRREGNPQCSPLAPPGPSGKHAVDSLRPPVIVRNPWVAGQMRWSPGLARPAGGQHPFRAQRGQPQLVPTSTPGAYPPGSSSHDPCGALMGVRRERQHLPPPRPLHAPSVPFAPAYRENSSGVEHGIGRNRSMLRDSRAPTGNRLGGSVNGNYRSLPADREVNDDEFGVMAPCWRLLERAKAYMDADQLEYMRGLILANVKKPMSRDQMLLRIESCLEGKDAIISSFMKMFDRIDQDTLVPLYSGKKGAPTASHSPAMSSVRPFPGSSAPQPGRSGPDPFRVSGYPSYSAGGGVHEAGSGHGSSRGPFSSNATLLHHVVSPAYAPADVRLRSAPPYGRSGRGEWNHGHHPSSAPMLTASQSDASAYPDRVRHLSQHPPSTPQWRGVGNASMMDIPRNGWGQR